MTRVLLLLPLLAACAGPGGAGCPGDITLVNQGQRPIEQFYAGGPQDLLDPDLLPPGQSRPFRATNPAAARLRVVFDDGRAAELGPVNLCELPRITVTARGIVATAR
ncbi:MAG: hypothetical protein RMK64_00105 [Rhodovarius sp.]|nr:hypothetical protein [Rhodovarius sp.]MCX7932553.1 hypothetical protein [Rhodovarius sp.]MDW8313344.1 hypothetical protein [Rhodovarius sp.]